MWWRSHMSEITLQSLPSSSLFDEHAFYNQFKQDLCLAKDQVLIESPYIACKRTTSLLTVFTQLRKRGVSIRINTRNPRHHDKEMRIQAWKMIKALRNLGVKVVYYDDLRHRKLAVIDSYVLWEGSLNILSQSNSKEIMRRTQSRELATQMIHFAGLKRWKF